MLHLAVLLFSCAIAQDIPPSVGQPSDPPRILVDPDLLELFGVSIDVNQPGLFKKVMTIPSNTDLGQLKPFEMASKKTLRLVHSFMQKSAINYSREYIQIYSELPEEEGAQLVAAHFVNIVFRFLNILSDQEGLAIRSINSLLDVMDKYPDQINILCRTNQLLSIPATSISREIDGSKSCSQITAIAKQGGVEAVNLRNQFTGIKAETEAALKALDTVRSAIRDTSVTIQDIANFVTERSILPESYKSLLIPLVVQSFSDYRHWITKISAEEARRLSSFLGGMDISQVRKFVIQSAFNLIKA